MIFPLKQYRHYLLIPVVLCTLSSLLFSAFEEHTAIADALKTRVQKSPVVEVSREVLNIAEAQLLPHLHQTETSVEYFSALSVPKFPKNSEDGSAVLTLHNGAEISTLYFFQVYSAAGEMVYDQDGEVPSRGSINFAADELTEIPDGEYHLYIASNRALNAVVTIEQEESQSLGLYAGVIPIAGTPVFGPFLTGNATSALVLNNTFASTSTLLVNFMDLSGTVVTTYSTSIAPNGVAAITESAVDKLPEDFVGTVRIASPDGQITGIIQQTDSLGKTTYQNALSQQARGVELLNSGSESRRYLPRLYNQASDGDGLPTRTSSYFVTITGASDATIVATAYTYSTGNEINIPNSLLIPPGGSYFRTLSEDDAFEAGLYSMVVSSDQPILDQTVTTFDGSTTYGVDSSRGVPGTPNPGALIHQIDAESTLWLPKVVKSEIVNSVISVQNITNEEGDFQISFFTRSGEAVYTSEIIEFLPNRAVAIDLRTIAGLPMDYFGSAAISASKELVGQVDEYRNFAPDTIVTPSLVVSGPERTLLNESVEGKAMVTVPDDIGIDEVFPVTYTWESGEGSLVAIDSNQNGITSTGTLTWSSAGIKTVNVTANTGLGDLTDTYTVSVSARSLSISSLQTTTLGYNEFDGTSIRILVPAQTIDGAIQLDYLPTPGIAGPTAEGFVDRAFQLNVVQNEQYVDEYEFELHIGLTIVYDPEVSAGDEAFLTLRRWNGSAWVNVASECGVPVTHMLDADNNRLTVEICRMGQFALFGAAERLYLPVAKG